MSRRRFDARARALVALRAEPREDAEQVTQALAEEPLWIDERRDGWARVLTFYGYPGWVREPALIGPPAAWALEATGAAPIDEARRYLGAPYEWGGMSERGVDCSGLIHMAFRRAGIVVPRDAHEQEEEGAPVAPEEARAGDLVTYGDASADHIAFWAGAGRILHASGREGVRRVLEEPEPEALRARRRRFVRFGGGSRLPRPRTPS